MSEKILNFIDGQLVEPKSNEYLDCYEPATGQVYASVANSGEKDLADAVASAQNAFPAWAATSPLNRSLILRNIAHGIKAHAEKFAKAETIDSGKPISASMKTDIPRSWLNFEFFADAITQFSSESHETDGGTLNFTMRSPLGIVTCIAPWNLPLYLLSWKIAPALAAGNCVLAKPSEVTPMTAFMLGEICNKAGLPKGVLNIVQGTGANVGSSMVKHPAVKAVSFTGSTAVGAEISKHAAPLFKKLSLEMGGKNPNIIFADCNFEKALLGTIRAAFSNQGQICLCGSRIFVERPIYEKFKSALVARINVLKIGDPLEESTDQGALVSKIHFHRVMTYIALAKKEGGTIVVGGEQKKLDGRCQGGWFMQPTLIEGLSNQCRTNQEEIFGPVATIAPFDTEEEVLAAANSTRYGLAASIWTNNLGRAHRMTAKIESGIVWVNCWMTRDLRTPFGGMKDSGVGREGGLDALRFFTDAKNVCVKYD